MAKETHISSIVVHARPEAAGGIRATIESLPGMEVHAVSPLGKMIVTLETESEADIVTNLNTISLLDGVYAATLVFHSVEDLTDSEEAPHEALTT
ncbi:chaperone NapD [Azospirillum soli]|uniref:chaperone NapD n=1 Tax=Azospirillum soli TaxID=1304799 RepID=UPI001AE32D3B|nr:chaperone NapD [Azospirillum soli]MBP2313903.1 nitrate reductase NapD [Azospirillum soli]